MGSSFLNQWFSHSAVNAICWTLIHSLWIGIIIALLTALVIILTRKSRADLRYRLLCGIMMLFVFSVSVIFFIEVRTTGAVQSNPNNVKLFMGPVNINVADNGFTTSHVSPVKVIVNFLDSNINIIFITWLLFFMMKSMKMVSGLLYIQRIRSYKIHAVAEEFKQKIELFSRRIGIRQTVSLVQSELVKVPVAVGWLKPMILLPIGIMLQLSPEQLDSILWHELAHIRRRDYLVNILQGVLETVFFFNPGLLWLSSFIRAEREACCDDMVLTQMNRKANYLEALLSFGFGEYKQASLAMGIGSGNQLRDRLKRMVSQENKRLGVIEKVVLITGVVLLSAFAGITKANKKYDVHTPKSVVVKTTDGDRKPANIINPVLVSQTKNTVTPEAGKINHKADTMPHFVDIHYEPGKVEAGIEHFITAKEADGTKYRIAIIRSKLVALSINGKVIEMPALSNYTYLLKQIPPPPPPPPAPTAQPASVTPRSGVTESKQDTLRLVHVSMSSYRNTADMVATDKVDAEDNRGKNYYFIINNEKVTSMDINGEKITESDLPRYQYMVRLVRENQKANAVRLNKKPGNVVVSEKPEKPQEPQAPEKAAIQPSVDKMITDVTNDLINENIIKDKNSLSTFKLTVTELVVNGVKQPDEIQKKLSTKYFKDPAERKVYYAPNYGLYYNAKNHGVAFGTFDLDLDAL